MADKKFTDKSVMWTLLAYLTDCGMFEDMSAKAAYEAVQELPLADEAYDKAWKAFGYRGSVITEAQQATTRRAAAIRAMRGES